MIIMTRTIEIQCCEGREEYVGQCLKSKCPWYRTAENEVGRTWPRMETGFGNAYGEPRLSNYLARVRMSIQNETKNVK